MRFRRRGRKGRRRFGMKRRRSRSRRRTGPVRIGYRM